LPFQGDPAEKGEQRLVDVEIGFAELLFSHDSGLSELSGWTKPVPFRVGLPLARPIRPAALRTRQMVEGATAATSASAEKRRMNLVLIADLRNRLALHKVESQQADFLLAGILTASAGCFVFVHGRVSIPAVAYLNLSIRTFHLERDR
jgi:hypothetical protein